MIECGIEQAEKARVWLEKAMLEEMDAVLNYAGEVHVPVKIETGVASSWGKGNMASATA